MKFKSLQIKLLSNSGELLNCISCYAGQVSVFRAYSTAELKPYQRALAGIPGPERFSILLNDQPWVPQEHNFIGFGERFTAGDHDLAVGDFLTQAGVPQNGVFSLLVSYSLENFASAKCASLPACEERRLRILAATYCTDKVLVLNDPLEPISAHWRERFAELLVNYARTKEQIVLVTSLTYRPDVWIENEFIDRIQVGENIQKTIGFGSGRSGVNALVTQLRAAFGKEQLPGTAKPGLGRQTEGGVSGASNLPGWEGDEKNKQDWPPRQVEKTGELEQEAAEPPYVNPTAARPINLPVWVIMGGVAIIGIVAVSLGVAFGRRIISGGGAAPEAQYAATQSQAASAPPAIETLQQPVSESAAFPAVEETAEPAVPVSPSSAQAIQPAKALYALDHYPADIRRAVLKSFEGNLADHLQQPGAAELKAPRVSTEEALKLSSAGIRQPAKPDRSKTAVDLLNVLQSASGTGDGLPDQIRPSAAGATSLSPEEMAKLSPEQRREVIRQKFLEAIQRAAQQKQQ